MTLTEHVSACQVCTARSEYRLGSAVVLCVACGRCACLTCAGYATSWVSPIFSGTYVCFECHPVFQE